MIKKCSEHTHPPSHPLHDAVQPASSPLRQSPQHLLLSAIVTPPPLAHEVEVVTQPEVSFKSLITLPVREWPTTSRQRAKPPPYDLTSKDHFYLIKEKALKIKQKQKQANKSMKQSTAKKTLKKVGQVNQVPCNVCQHSYGDSDDPKSTEEWVSCAVCSHWFHESCAEDNGEIDDDNAFTCKGCLFPEM